MKSITIIILAFACLMLTSALLDWSFVQRHWSRQGVIIVFMVFELWFFWTMLKSISRKE